jgi:branched-chain amino acid transport system ATP-binding protein
MLRIDHLSVSYGKASALRDVSLQVNKGELVALLGSNGAGKSTLLKTISGLMRASGGSIEFEGQNLSKMPAHQIVEAGVVQVPEGREIFPDLSVLDNLRAGAYTRHEEIKVAEDMKFIFDFFPRLAERQTQLAGTLSGGEAQMLAIGRGILSNPKLLMLDEPSLGLAPKVRHEIYEVVQQIYEKRGVTILLVEQNAKWALEVASRAYILENGRVTIEGSGQDLAQNEHVQRAFLGY